MDTGIGMDKGMYVNICIGAGLAIGIGKGEWVDSFQQPRQTQYIVHVSSSSFGIDIGIGIRHGPS